MKKIICVGHSAYDITMPIDSYPVENNKYYVDKMAECGGGSAGNGAYLLAKWGMDTTYAGAVGADLYGHNIEKEFASVGTNLKYFRKINGQKTPYSFILANQENGSRTLFSHTSSGINLDNIEVTEKYDVLLNDGYYSDTALKVIKDNPNIISILDAGKTNEETLRMAKEVDYLVASKNFAEQFTKLKIENNFVEVFAMMEQTFKKHIIITLEEEGCIFKENNIIKKMPIIKNKEVDTTGTGDIFHGAFAYGIASGYSLIDTIRVATVAAGLSVKYLGGRNSIRSKSEVMEILSFEG